MTDVATITDAQPDAWKGENKPDIDPDLIRLCQAHDRLKLAQAAVDSHAPPYAGPAWAEKTQAYERAKRELDAIFNQIKGSKP